MTKGLFNLKEITENSIILLFVYPTFLEKVTGRCSIIKIALNVLQFTEKRLHPCLFLNKIAGLQSAPFLFQLT